MRLGRKKPISQHTRELRRNRRKSLQPGQLLIGWFVFSNSHSICRDLFISFVLFRIGNIRETSAFSNIVIMVIIPSVVPSPYSTRIFLLLGIFLPFLFALSLLDDCNFTVRQRQRRRRRQSVPFTNSPLSHFANSFSMKRQREKGWRRENVFSIFPFYYMPFNEMRKEGKQTKMEVGLRQVEKDLECVHMKEFVLLVAARLIIYVNLWLRKMRKLLSQSFSTFVSNMNFQ